MEPQAPRSQIPGKFEIWGHKCLTLHHGPEKAEPPLLWHRKGRSVRQEQGGGEVSPHRAVTKVSSLPSNPPLVPVTFPWTGPCPPPLPRLRVALLTLWGQTEGETNLGDASWQFEEFWHFQEGTCNI